MIYLYTETPIESIDKYSTDFLTKKHHYDCPVKLYAFPPSM